MLSATRMPPMALPAPELKVASRAVTTMPP